MRFHILGLGPVGSLVSHHLNKTLDTTKHGVVLVHKNTQQLKRANSIGNTLKIERQGVVDTSMALLSEVFEPAKQLRYGKRRAKRLSRDNPTSKDATADVHNPKASDNPRAHIQHTFPPIESLIVAIKAYAVVDSVKALLPRLTPTSTIVLLHNGMGVYERLVEDVFRNPEQRPHFIVAVNDHGAWNKDFFHTVHAGVGSITFGIVTDPRGKNFEAPAPEMDNKNVQNPNQEPGQSLSLDNIVSLQERDGSSSPYLSLYNTVAALSNLSELNATWKPISHVETAMKRKLVVNSVINPLTALLGCRNGELLESAEARKIIKRVCSEASHAFAMQAQEEDGFHDDREKQVRMDSGLSRASPGLVAHALERECLRVIKATAHNISSMLSDVRVGSYTEIDYLNGYLLGLARPFGLPMTTTTTLLNLIKMRTSIPLDRLVYK